MKQEKLERHDTVIVDGTSGRIARLLPRRRALLVWSDENGMERTKEVWQKRCEILEKYSDN